METQPEFKKSQFSIGMLLAFIALAAVFLCFFNMTHHNIQNVPEPRDGIVKICITGEGYHSRANFKGKLPTRIVDSDDFEVVAVVEQPKRWTLDGSRAVSLYPDKGPFKEGACIYVYRPTGQIWAPNWCYCDQQETRFERIRNFVIQACVATIACLFIGIYIGLFLSGRAKVRGQSAE
jgi:hypothetical protein